MLIFTSNQAIFPLSHLEMKDAISDVKVSSFMAHWFEIAVGPHAWSPQSCFITFASLQKPDFFRMIISISALPKTSQEVKPKTTISVQQYLLFSTWSSNAAIDGDFTFQTNVNFVRNKKSLIKCTNDRHNVPLYFKCPKTRHPDIGDYNRNNNMIKVNFLNFIGDGVSKKSSTPLVLSFFFVEVPSLHNTCLRGFNFISIFLDLDSVPRLQNLVDIYMDGLALFIVADIHGVPIVCNAGYVYNIQFALGLSQQISKPAQFSRVSH